MSKDSNKEKEAAVNGDELVPLHNPTMQPTVGLINGENCCEGGRIVIINVGGQKHECLRKIFINEKFSQSRLWKAMRANTVDEILTQCDRYRSNDDVPEFFFDHNYTGFINILDAYRTGHLHLNAYNCAVITREDLNYWGIDDLLVEPCCAVKYYSEIEVCQSELDMEEDEKRKTIEREKLEDFGPSSLGKTRKFLWDLFEYPHTSKGAQVSSSSSSTKHLIRRFLRFKMSSSEWHFTRETVAEAAAEEVLFEFPSNP